MKTLCEAAMFPILAISARSPPDHRQATLDNPGMAATDVIEWTL
jgi:hypothetical protein